ncbi:MAG: hypothetical protein JWO76_158 [Nocardioides sp.]|nr:hypothetical protein [Nocardioides sp.]
MRRGLVALACALTLASAGLSACGSDDDKASGEHESSAEHEQEQELEKAADQNTCLADAEAIDAPYDAGFPDAFVFPAQTTVYDVEDRDETGVIVTAVTATPFQDVLDFLNEDEVAAGFEITGGETEEHDAEANWKSGDQTGRWAIRESAQCPGETVIQVLASPTD